MISYLKLDYIRDKFLKLMKTRNEIIKFDLK